MNYRALFLALCIVAALVPLASRPSPAQPHSVARWPETLEGKPIHRVPLSEAERGFNSDFPGEVVRFSDGEREFIVRWITAGTRKLHSAADCFRGLGHTIHAAPIHLDEHGRRWNCFTATRGPNRVGVRERICDEKDTQSWTDVSAWYWSTLLGRSRGPWLAVTIIESENR